MKDKTTHLYVDSHERTLILHSRHSDRRYAEAPRAKGQLSQYQGRSERNSNGNGRFPRKESRESP